MIKSFKGDATDNELRDITAFLEDLADKSDVRPVKDKYIDFSLSLETDRFVESPVSRECEKKFMAKFKAMAEEDKFNMETDCEFWELDENPQVEEVFSRCEIRQRTGTQKSKASSLSYMRSTILSDQQDPLKYSMENIPMEMQAVSDQLELMDVTERVDQDALVENLPRMMTKSQYLRLSTASLII